MFKTPRTRVRRGLTSGSLIEFIIRIYAWKSAETAAEGQDDQDYTVRRKGLKVILASSSHCQIISLRCTNQYDYLSQQDVAGAECVSS